jgi:hypothetical protein
MKLARLRLRCTSEPGKGPMFSSYHATHTEGTAEEVSVHSRNWRAHRERNSIPLYTYYEVIDLNDKAHDLPMAYSSSGTWEGLRIWTPKTEANDSFETLTLSPVLSLRRRSISSTVRWSPNYGLFWRLLRILWSTMNSEVFFLLKIGNTAIPLSCITGGRRRGLIFTSRTSGEFAQRKEEGKYRQAALIKLEEVSRV